MESHSIPFLRETKEILINGISPLKDERVLAHPVQHIQNNWLIDEISRENFALKNTFGSQMVMRLEMEKEILGQFRRLPVLPSSFVGLETMLGTDEDIDFEDYLDDPRNSEITPPSLHNLMEAKLGMHHTKL